MFVRSEDGSFPMSVFPLLIYYDAEDGIRHHRGFGTASPAYFHTETNHGGIYEKSTDPVRRGIVGA